MREKHFYILLGEEKDVRTILSLVDTSSAQYSINSLEVFTDTEKYELLHKLCKERRVRPHLARFEMEYTKRELETAEFLNLQMRTYCSAFAEDYGTTYNYSEKCECCGSGKKLISDLTIDKSKMGKKDISLTYGLEVVISERLYQLLLDNNLTGFSVGAVKHKNEKMKNEPTLYQLFCTNTLAPLDKQSVFYKEKYCECCHRSGLFL